MPGKFSLLVLSVSAFAWAQDGASLDGTVINSVTHAGIGGVDVRVFSKDSTRYQTTTDAAGAFHISGMKEGDYSSSLEKQGFVVPNAFEFGPRPTFHVSAGKDATRLDVQMAPLAKLSGRVLDSEGKPAAKVEVSAQGNLADTDDNGRFTFEELKPGSYTLLARPPETDPKIEVDGERLAVLPTYFPSAVDASQAEAIRVSAGDQLSGFEVRLRKLTVYRVRGVVVDEMGKPVPQATVHLTASNGLGGFGISTSANGVRQYRLDMRGSGGPPIAEVPLTAKDGSFEFAAVRPGEWRIDAVIEADWDKTRNLPNRLQGAGAVVVEHKDIDGLQIQLSKPFQLTAEVEGDGLALPPGMPTTALLALTPADGQPLAVIPPGKDGISVYPGHYRVGTWTPGYYPVSATLGGRDVLGQVVDLQPSSAPLHVGFKRSTSRIRGTVENGAGASVLIWPQQTEELTTVTQVPCGPNGAFESGGLLPGDYYIAAFDHVAATQLAGNSTILSSFIPKAVGVRVEEGATSAVQLAVNPWPE